MPKDDAMKLLAPLLILFVFLAGCVSTGSQELESEEELDRIDESEEILPDQSDSQDVVEIPDTIEVETLGDPDLELDEEETVQEEEDGEVETSEVPDDPWVGCAPDARELVDTNASLSPTVYPVPAEGEEDIWDVMISSWWPDSALSGATIIPCEDSGRHPALDMGYGYGVWGVHSDRVWFTNLSGLWVYEVLETGPVFRCLPEIGEPAFALSGVVEDCTETLWVGLDGRVAHKSGSGDWVFETLPEEISGFVMALAVDGDNVAAQTRHGVAVRGADGIWKAVNAWCEGSDLTIPFVQQLRGEVWGYLQEVGPDGAMMTDAYFGVMSGLAWLDDQLYVGGKGEIVLIDPSARNCSRFCELDPERHTTVIGALQDEVRAVQVDLPEKSGWLVGSSMHTSVVLCGEGDATTMVPYPEQLYLGGSWQSRDRLLAMYEPELLDLYSEPFSMLCGYRDSYYRIIYYKNENLRKIKLFGHDNFILSYRCFIRQFGDLTNECHPTSVSCGFQFSKSSMILFQNKRTVAGSMVYFIGAIENTSDRTIVP
jgi:hypothetical protein